MRLIDADNIIVRLNNAMYGSDVSEQMKRQIINTIMTEPEATYKDVVKNDLSIAMFMSDKYLSSELDMKYDRLRNETRNKKPYIDPAEEAMLRYMQDTSLTMAKILDFLKECRREDKNDLNGK